MRPLQADLTVEPEARRMNQPTRVAGALPSATLNGPTQPSWRVLPGVKRMPRRTIPRMWWAAGSGLLVAVLILYVHTVVQEAALMRDQKDLKELKQQITRQRSHLASLENPRLIEAKAVHSLAMVQPEEVVFMPRVSKAKSVGGTAMPPPQSVIHEGF